MIRALAPVTFLRLTIFSSASLKVCGLKETHLLEIITIVACRLHQPFGVLFIKVLPPQAEEQGAVLHLRRELVHAGHQGLRGLVLCIRRKGKACKSI